jgi:hypothetical protein
MEGPRVIEGPGNLGFIIISVNPPMGVFCPNARRLFQIMFMYYSKTCWPPRTVIRFRVEVSDLYHCNAVQQVNVTEETHDANREVKCSSRKCQIPEDFPVFFIRYVTLCVSGS